MKLVLVNVRVRVRIVGVFWMVGRSFGVVRVVGVLVVRILCRTAKHSCPN